MAETETIAVAEVSDGFGASGEADETVSLPVVELLTGRGFVTGKSGSGKSNSASVIAEKLLDNGFGLLIVDIDGEYYGLKEEYEILHAGADEGCDIQVTTDHAEKLATLALEQNVPIILDISSYLDESEAEAVLTAVARRLFAKAKKKKQPFLLLVEEVHEYIPEKGAVGECGKMLIKIGKRGRKHGLGICGISQRPADVKKDFITQCDWLLWHRLTWNNDTTVVGRILDGEYADAVEDLDDGEGFLMTDWSETVRRVQFYRKQTFDAGATPGLDDFERPELKSVSADLVSELEEISEDEQAREDRIRELREQLDQKNSRIAELETELKDARDLSRMADQFVETLVGHLEGQVPGRTEREQMRTDWDERSSTTNGEGVEVSPQTENGSSQSKTENEQEPGEPNTDPKGTTDSESGSQGDETVTAVSADGEMEGIGGKDETNGATATGAENERVKTETETPESERFSAEAVFESLDSAAELSTADVLQDDPRASSQTTREAVESKLRLDSESVTEEERSVSETSLDDGTSKRKTPDETPSEEASADRDEPLVVRELKADIAAMDTKTRAMLAYYREFGPETALNAHFGAGGDGDRTSAYAHNRTLRTHGLIEHVGRGRYEYRLRELLREEFGTSLGADAVGAYARQIEKTVLDSQ